MDGLITKYFILRPRSKYKGDAYAEASRNAMRTYAKSIESTNPELAKDLRHWSNAETDHNLCNEKAPIPRYKRIVAIEAVQYNDDSQFEQLKAFVGEQLYFDMKIKGISDTGIKIKTFRSVQSIYRGDYIVKSGVATFHVYKPKIFEALYERIKE